MGSENLSNSFITLSSLTSFLTFLFVSKSNIINNNKLFLDEDYSKPQAFHQDSIPRTGGVASIVALLIFFVFFKSLFKTNISDYIYFSFILFFLGFSEDVKLNTRPLHRLIAMIAVIAFGIYFFDIYIYKSGFGFLNYWLENTIFQFFFVLLCFLFIINGSNLIDGFNGLLALQLIIINIILLYLNLIYGKTTLSLFLAGQIFILFCFLLFNFPKAKMFMGDSGAYLFGGMTSINVIKTSSEFEIISPLFFTSLLFYIFFEVFFSFIRKIKQGKSPLHPDSYHLHMLIYKILNYKNNRLANPLTSLIINFAFFLMMIPLLYFRENGLFCRYWFIFQILMYILVYLKLYNFTKKIN